VDEAVHGVYEPLSRGLPEGDDLHPDAPLHEDLEDLHKVPVPAPQDHHVQVGHEAHHVGGDAHVPVALVDGPSALPGLLHRQVHAPHPVADGGKLVDEGPGRGVPLLLHHVGRGPDQAPPPHGEAEEAFKVDVPLVVVPGGVVEVLGVHEHPHPLVLVVAQKLHGPHLIPLLPVSFGPPCWLASQHGVVLPRVPEARRHPQDGEEKGLPQGLVLPPPGGRGSALGAPPGRC
jgi:hypothetical protein